MNLTVKCHIHLSADTPQRILLYRQLFIDVCISGAGNCDLLSTVKQVVDESIN